MGGYGEAVAVLRRVGGVQPGGDPPQFVGAAPGEQERHGLGQRLQDEGHEQQGHAGGEEYRLPAMALQQALAQQRRQHAAERIAAEHQRHQGGAHLPGRVFRHVRHHARHHAADAQPREEAHRAERHRALRQAGPRGEDAEQRQADDDGPAAPDAVRHGAQQDGAEHHAEQRGAHHEARVGGVHAHLGHDRWQGDADDGQVVAVEHDDQRAPEKHQCVEPVEAGGVRQMVEVDRAHVRCLRCVVFGIQRTAAASALPADHLYCRAAGPTHFQDVLYAPRK